jgi:hypothetical protein
MLSNGKIEICPLAFMRGRTFKDSFIIADEMQNSSPNQMKMLTTRLGLNCRMVITGDLAQTDFIKENGLYDLVERLKNINETSDLIQQIHFNNSDIERSVIVKKMIEIYEQNNDKKFVKSKLIKSKPIKSKPIKSKPTKSKPIKSKPTKSKPIKNDTLNVIFKNDISNVVVKNDTSSVIVKNDTLNLIAKNETKIYIYNRTKNDGNNDAALIPIFHATKYHDIFTDKMCF